MIWHWTGGEPDNNSPHFVNLVMDELQGYDIGPIVLSDSPDLVDGAIYSLLYVALDPAGNQSDTTRKVDILFDVTPPKIAALLPEFKSSASVDPGSLKCTRVSIPPGKIINLLFLNLKYMPIAVPTLLFNGFAISKISD